MGTPARSSKASIRARGTAAPPAVTPRKEERSTAGSAATRSRSFQMVGTPQASVTRCSAMIRARCSPWRNIWGMTRLVPTMKPA